MRVRVFGFSPANPPWHVHDIQVNVLHLLGRDHTKLTFKFPGSEFRLTDVAGQVIRPLLM